MMLFSMVMSLTACPLPPLSVATPSLRGVPAISAVQVEPVDRHIARLHVQQITTRIARRGGDDGFNRRIKIVRARHGAVSGLGAVEGQGLGDGRITGVF